MHLVGLYMYCRMMHGAYSVKFTFVVTSFNKSNSRLSELFISLTFDAFGGMYFFLQV